MKRCSILVLYDKDGIIDEYVFFIINQLQRVSQRLIIVVNGEIDELYLSRMKKINKEVILRKNKGFDAAAYKEILLNYLSKEERTGFDEIIFCNDTFFGFFTPIDEIFKRMEIGCDFWGISYVDDWLDKFIHSFFMVFKKEIVENDELYNFFSKHDKFETYADVGYYYERKIFEYLTNKGYKFNTLMGKQEYSIYRESNRNIEDGYPYLKKKAFINRNYNHNVIMNSLNIINKNTDYDIDYILNSVKRSYGVDIKIEDVIKYKCDISQNSSLEKMISIEKTIEFINDNDNIYIYGVNGSITQIILDKLQIKNLKGFIVSKGHKKENYYLGFPVYEIDEIPSNENIGIIVALWYQNSQKVRNNLENKYNILYLWQGMN